MKDRLWRRWSRGFGPRLVLLILTIVVSNTGSDAEAQAVASGSRAAAWLDIRDVPADLATPAMTDELPAAGRRVRQRLAGWGATRVYHVLYLPANWRPGPAWPVLVEYAGNGNYSNKYGDVSIGRPEGSNLGYGLSGGRGYLWLCLPYLDGAGTNLAITWWGDKPTYDPQPTLRYAREAVASVCREFGGDTNRVVLCGFSRGAIACNYLGLHDDETARLWCGFLAFSHYDGIRTWPYPGSDRASAAARLKRLAGRPQFICGEGGNSDETRAYLQRIMPDGPFTFVGTGFRNHNDAWVLRPSPARDRAREWLRVVTAGKR